MTLYKLSLCSGIGGDDLASEWAGIETVCFVEKDKFCQQVLRKHWPKVPIIGDLKDVTQETLRDAIGVWQPQQERGKSNVGRRPRNTSEAGVDLVSAGWPCQPHSVAGSRKASGDERDLWPEVRRILSEIKPRWFVGENVPGLFTSERGHFFGTVLSDLASLGYFVGWCCYGACDMGAHHKRDRIFIVAYYAGQFLCPGQSPKGEGGDGEEQARVEVGARGKDAANADKQGLEGWGRQELQECAGQRTAGESSSPLSDSKESEGAGRHSWLSWKGEMQLGGGSGGNGELGASPFSIWESEPNVGRVAHGISRRVDRLRALGNACVSQQIYPVYKAIVEVETAGDAG